VSTRSRVARVFTGIYNTCMASSQEHLTELLKLPSEGRARAARALLESLDEDGTEGTAEESQVAELVRRMQSLDAGEITLVNGTEARARVKARLKLGGK
jgi:putative addiction module component (TIGR02574 family)